MFTQPNIPYNTQLVPLAALHVELGHELDSLNAKLRLERWYWCGIFGEMYGSSVESQYARDLPEVAEYVRNGVEPQLIRDANFAPNRLVSLRTRQSAAYKGLYALQMKSGAADWLSGQSLTLADWHNQNIDIHHIFPRRWCERESVPRVPKSLYDSIINKSPIDARTNRIIGGNAPSRYLSRLKQGNDRIAQVLETHWLDSETLESDQFARCFVERGEAMLELVAHAMDKTITGGQDTFWGALSSAGVAGASPTAVAAEIDFTETSLDDETEFDALGEGPTWRNIWPTLRANPPSPTPLLCAVGRRPGIGGRP